MGGFIVPVIEVVIAILDIYWWLVIIQAVVSWLIAFNILNTYSRPVAMVLDFLYRMTEPALRPIRQFMPILGGLDISPIICSWSSGSSHGIASSHSGYGVVDATLADGTWKSHYHRHQAQ